MKLALKADRLTLKADFEEVRMKGGKRVSTLLVMNYIDRSVPGEEETVPRCAVICSRHFDKRAVRRNRARRITFEAFRLLRKRLSTCLVVFRPRRPILNVRMQDVMVAMEKMMFQAGLLKDSRR